MKTPRLPASFWIGLVLLALGAGACKKEDPETEGLSFIGAVPYYRFTANDRLWLQAKQGDEWKLENARGYQRVYRIAQVIQNIRAENKSTSFGIPSSAKLESYYDQTTVRLARTDSILPGGFLLGGGNLHFLRDARMLTNLNSGGFDKNASQFYIGGEFYEFVGNTDLISDYFDCQGLKFPQGAALNGPFSQLTVRGRQYNDVVAFIGMSPRPSCAPGSSSRVQELYYDRQVGLVRLVSRAGEVWDRVP